MTRRSTPQKKIDDNAFPVRVKVYVPENGFGRLMDDIFVWLKTQLEAYRYAHHSSGAGGGRDQTAFYFATTSDADAFMRAFPEIELADGTLEITYTAPGFIHPLGQTRMCNLYNQTTSQEAMRRLFDDLEDHTGNLQSGQVYPNQMAPIVRCDEGRNILQIARWGLPTPKSYLVGKNYDKGVTNVRNTASPHWRRWLGPEHRCLVPFNRFAEPAPGRGNQWFAMPEDRQAFFAGIYVPGWTSTRKVKDGETTDNLFGFLTTDANAEVSAFHPKAMPVVLQSDADLKIWLQSGWDEAKELQRPLPDKSLELVDLS